MPAGATVITKWNPTRLNRAITGAFPKSVKVAQGDAKSRLHNKSKSDVGLRVVNSTYAILYPKGLAAVFEKGRQGGYEINPSGVIGVRRSYSNKTKTATYSARGKRGGTGFALKFPGPTGNNVGGFSAVAVLGGKMGKYPALKPAGQDWALKGYATVAKLELARSGYGVRAA